MMRSVDTLIRGRALVVLIGLLAAKGAAGQDLFEFRIDGPSEVLSDTNCAVKLKGTSTRTLLGYTATISYQQSFLVFLGAFFEDSVWKEADYAFSLDDPARGTVTIAVVMDKDGVGAQEVPEGPQKDFVALQFRARTTMGSTVIGFQADTADANMMADSDLQGHDVQNGLALVPHEINISSLLTPFVRGNCNQGINIDLSDAIFILQFLFVEETLPSCPDGCDANDDGKLDISDALKLLAYLFQGGSPPPAPFPKPGFDMTNDPLGCEPYAGR